MSIPSTSQRLDDDTTKVLIKNLAQERLKSASLSEQVLHLQEIVNHNNANQQKDDDQMMHATDTIDTLHHRIAKETASRGELHEKLDQLEHRNLQLQAENDTIGEYVSLYREQRGALKQMQYQESQKQACLDDEKEIMKQKLEYLELLVKQLLADRTMVDEKSPDLNDQEIVTAEKIFEIIDDVVDSGGVDVEPLQLNIPYYGPQWDI